MPDRVAGFAPANVLYLCSDEHTRHVLGCYGNPVVRTPNLDALAARGTRFSSAYTPFPICVPARACLATGRYAHQLGIWDNGAPYTGAQAPSWGHRLTAQGHEVTTIGKLHFRSVEDDTGFPDQRLPMHVLDGVGDVFGLLRADSPVRPGGVRTPVQEAGPGESEYTRYDRGIAAAAGDWLAAHAVAPGAPAAPPWALFVSFVTPHFPLVVPQEYFDLYPPDSLPLPRCGTPETWSTHPALAWKRRIQAIEEPFPEPVLRRAIAAYYGMVTFLDEQIGRVLRALDAAGLTASTRVIYSTDHGEQLGDHGLWWKGVMLEGAAGVPLLMAGPGVPAGRVVATPVSLVDVFPTVVEAAGAALAPEDAGLPGASLLGIATAPDDATRAVFAEYHASNSSTAYYLLRRGRYKYLAYVGYPAQLFDLEADPDEAHDLAGDPQHAGRLAAFERALRAVVDPEAVDATARADQRARIDAAGGLEAVRGAGARFSYTPAPAGFDPAPMGEGQPGGAG